MTELKLAEYNGLHLALRGRTMGIPSIVVAEKAFEHEVEQLGVTWLSPESSAGDDLQITLTRLTQGSRSSSQYPWYEATDGDNAPVAPGDLTTTPNFSGLLH
ncbi:MAG: hypothetical protein H0T71_15015 [Acidobacteria bacterium]|nr:hypothetical protein [Acidobacteriota bacterium]